MFLTVRCACSSVRAFTRDRKERDVMGDVCRLHRVFFFGTGAGMILQTHVQHVLPCRTGQYWRSLLCKRSHVALVVKHGQNKTSKTPEGRSATFWVQGSGCVFLFFVHFQFFIFSFSKISFFVLTRVSFHVEIDQPKFSSL